MEWKGRNEEGEHTTRWLSMTALFTLNVRLVSKRETEKRAAIWAKKQRA